MSGRLAMLAFAAALVASGCGTRTHPNSGAGLDAPPAEGGVGAATPATPPPGTDAEPTDALPVRWPLTWDATRALPSCGTHEPVRIQRRAYPVPLSFRLSAEMQRANAHFAAFIGVEPDWAGGNGDLAWTRQDLAVDGPSVSGAIDCVVECDGIPWDPLSRDSLYFLALGFDVAGAPVCAWTDDGSAFEVRFHSLAEPLAAVVTRGFPGPCDPTNPRGALLGQDDRIVVRAIVRCSECGSPYFRVWVARTSDDHGLDRVDAVVDQEFTTRVEAGTAVSFEAKEVLGSLTGRLEGIEVREGMDPVEIRIEGGAVDSVAPRPAGRLLLPPGAEFRRDRGGASSMNPGMNRSDHVYAVPGTLDEVEVFYRETLGIEPSRNAGQITFPLGDLGRRDSDLPGAERTLVIRQEGDQVFVHVRCRGCY